MSSCPKSGLFNPLKNPNMYRKWGEIMFRVAEQLHQPKTEELFKTVMQNCVPKSKMENFKEFLVGRQGVENFCGDNPRFAMEGFVVAGDRDGQQSVGYRFPYGPTGLITPFNFPFEILILQLVGACITGNKTIIKPDVRGAPVAEALVRLFKHCGMPNDTVILANANREDSAKLFEQLKDTLRVVQFTGSSVVAEQLIQQYKGKVKIEDSGFNWKILGPDVQKFDYVVGQADQDSFACAGQKCSSQRVLLVHENWVKNNFIGKFVERCSKRNLNDLTVAPLLSVSNEDMKARINEVLALPGSKVLTGGNPVTDKNSVPSVYGLFEPTVISVPFEHFNNKDNHSVLFKECFGPLVLVTEYKHDQMQQIVDMTEAIEHHLTASIVSNDPHFYNFFAKNTVNGVTYIGLNARTTGAPQNHFFGPSNDPRGAGIGTIEAIVNTWTCHREVVYDFGDYNEQNVEFPQT